MQSLTLIMSKTITYLIFTLMLFLSACSPSQQSITVVNKPIIDCGKNYTVRGYDTFARIANICDLSIQQLADLNQLYPPYHLTTNQVLRLTYTDKQMLARVAKQTPPTTGATVPSKDAKSSKVPYGRILKRPPQKINHKNKWVSPTKAPIKSRFSLKQDRLGIEFNTKPKQTIYAIANGEVVYSGARMLTHGKMIILKHANSFYSSYTQNSELLVKDGQKIHIGEAIAITGKKPFRLEMRKQSKPVNPADYIKDI